MEKIRRIGFHTSIAGGIDKSLERINSLGCNTLQIFSHNPRGWEIKEKNPEEINRFKTLRKSLGISPVIIHTSYLINLASPNNELIKKSEAMIISEMDIADSICAEYVVLHTGSASGDDPANARRRSIECLNRIAERGRWKAGLLLENTAGERGDITSKIKDLAEIIDSTTTGLISGICLDTCHAFAAGYDISKAEGLQLLIEEIDEFVGIDKIRLIHLNDSKGICGSGVDRHEHIGTGNIGRGGIQGIVKAKLLSAVPMILETPKKEEDDDARNLATVEKLFAD